MCKNLVKSGLTGTDRIANMLQKLHSAASHLLSDEKNPNDGTSDLLKIIKIQNIFQGKVIIVNCLCKKSSNQSPLFK